MARSKKADEKATGANATLQISVEDFIRTRDSVVTGLATLQSAVQDLSRAYIAHTNTVIGKAPGVPGDYLGITPLGTEGLFGTASTASAANAEASGPKKRKRAPHDTNAPKRPVTPYFLYMKTKKQEIASEMPQGHTAKQVSEEGARRWNAMTETEKKQTWGYKYAINFARYKEMSRAYKEGRPIPDIDDDEAKEIYDEQVRTGKMAKIEPPLDVGEEGAQEEEEADTSEEAESEPESESSEEEQEPEPEPVKAPSPPKSSRASKRQKGTAPDKKPSPVKQATEEAESSPAEKEANKSPELERKKKGSKKKEASQPKAEPVVAPVSSPPKLSKHDSQQKPKKSRKKRKSEAMEE